MTSRHSVTITTSAHVRDFWWALIRANATSRMSFKKQNPSDFLKLIIGKPVVVKLNSGVDYRGKDECSVFVWCALIRITYAYRRSCLFGWLYEYSTGADGRVCKWTGMPFTSLSLLLCCYTLAPTHAVES